MPTKPFDASPAKIRIAFVTSMLIKMGGSERNLHDLALGLKRKGYEPYIVAFMAGEVAQALKSDGIPVHEMPVRRLLSMDTLCKGIRFVKFLKEQRIDIVVTYHVDADIFGGILAKVAGVPVVISNRRDMGFKHRDAHVGFYRIFGKLITAFVAVSNAVRDVVVNRDGVGPRKVHVVHNGVSNDLLRDNLNPDQLPNDLSAANCRIVIGVLGRLEYIKGQKALVRLAYDLKGRVPEFLFLCVGLSDTDYYHEMADMIKDAGVSEHFRFVGHQNHVSQFLKEMNFLVFPSKSEGFSNAIIESMAMGKPVIATHVGGNPEAVLDGETGFLVSPDRPEELLKAVETLCMDDRLRHDMGIKARARAEEMFTIEKMVRSYENIFHHYLNGHKLG